MDEVSQKEESLRLKETDDTPGGVAKESEKNDCIAAAASSSQITISDNYEVIEPIGSGGMGNVYKVKDLSLNKIFAVKILDKEIAQDNAQLKRFEQETEATSKLSHENVISIYKHGKTESGEPYLVMDYLEGKSLAQLIEEESLNTEQIIDIFIQICRGLEHAHEKGIIHRDIKPSNVIIIQNPDSSLAVKIVDFGIAKVKDTSVRETHNLTQTGEVFGSPQYMSPEQCLGFMLNEQSDIYSLGCTLYETITGAPPYSGSNPVQLVVKHINDDIKGFNNELKSSKKVKQLEKVTLKCLEKEQSDRIQSIGDLKANLEAIKAGKSIPNYSIKSKAKPSITKNQLVIVAGVIVGMFLFYLTTFNGNIIYGRYQIDPIKLLLNSFFLLILCVFSSTLMNTAIENFRSLKEKHQSARVWWSMLAAFCASIATISISPYVVSFLFEFNSYFTIPDWYGKIEAIGLYVHCLLILLLVSSGIGFIVFKKLKNVNAFYIISRQILILLALLAVSYYAIPDRVSNAMKEISSKTMNSFPHLSLSIHKFGANLSTARIYELKQFTYKQYNILGAKSALPSVDKLIKELEQYIALAKNDNLSSGYYHQELANLYEFKGLIQAKQNNLKDALKNIKKAEKHDKGFVYFDMNNRKNFQPPKNYHLLKSKIYFLQNDFDSALSEYQKSDLNNNKYNSTIYEDSLTEHDIPPHSFIYEKMLAGLGRYESSLESINKIRINSFMDNEIELIRALLYEKLGQFEKSKKYYKIVAKRLPPDETLVTIDDKPTFRQFLFEKDRPNRSTHKIDFYQIFARYKLGDHDFVRRELQGGLLTIKDIQNFLRSQNLDKFGVSLEMNLDDKNTSKTDSSKGK